MRSLQEIASIADNNSLDAAHSAIGGQSTALAPLLSLPIDQQFASGFGHTLTEILQQPWLWADTALRTEALFRSSLGAQLKSGRIASIAITGSGSSHYAAELAAPALQAATALPVRAIPSGDLLSHGKAALPLPAPVLLVSLARSGNSPESVAAVCVVRQEAPDSLFLNITCNAEGQLAREGNDQSGVSQLLLHPHCHDKSLVMTSSFTSMALALIVLGRLTAEEALGGSGTATAKALASFCEHSIRFMPRMADAIASLPYESLRRAVFLGAGCQFGAARESALKLTEMTAGRIVSMHESFLGLRHGPMAAIDDSTLVLAMLPPDPRSRRYAQDLLAELERKQLGRCIAVVDDEVSLDSRAVSGSTAGNLPGEDLAALLGVLAGQWTGFFACRHHGLRPDAPAETGVITRVVEPFPLYH